MKKRSKWALYPTTAILAMTVLTGLGGCGADQKSDTKADNDQSAVQTSAAQQSGTAETVNTEEASGTEETAVIEENETPEDNTPASYNDSRKGKIKTRTLMYYMDGELADDSLVYVYEYDENGRVDKMRLTYRDEYHQYQYDDHGNIIKYQDILDGNAAVTEYFEYEYYDNGQMSRKTTYSSNWGDPDAEPYKSRTILYDTQGRETEQINYEYWSADAESSHYTFVYDDSKPHECVINVVFTEYNTDKEVEKVSNYMWYGYTLPDPRGEYRFDEYDWYSGYDPTTEAEFYEYYITCTDGPLNCTYDDHGSVIDDGVKYTYAYEYGSNGMLLKAGCYYPDGGYNYEYEYDGNGNIIRNKRHDIERYDAKSLVLHKPYNELVFQYEYY